jgi:hypothetical protein
MAEGRTPLLALVGWTVVDWTVSVTFLTAAGLVAARFFSKRFHERRAPCREKQQEERREHVKNPGQGDDHSRKRSRPKRGCRTNQRGVDRCSVALLR